MSSDRKALDAARTAARAWIEGYGIRTEPYTRSGGDHPMMDTLPEAFLAFAAALRTDTDPSLERVEAMRRRASEAALSVADDLRARAKRMEADAALRDCAGFVDSCANFVDLLSFKIVALPVTNEGAGSC